MTTDECACGFDGDMWMCIERRVYGPCEAENCSGVCEYLYDCECACHTTSEGS